MKEVSADDVKHEGSFGKCFRFEIA